MPQRASPSALWRTATLVALAAFFGADAAAYGQPLQMNPGLAQLLRYFELRVSSGRIAVRSPHKDRKLESQTSNNERRERLSVTLSGGATTVGYELVASDRQISFEILDGSEVLLRREAKDSKAFPHLVFHQPPEGRVSLRLGEGAQERELVAENLWRLLVAEPDARRELTPLLELLKPDWRLAETAEAAEKALFDSVRAMSAADQEKLRRLVGELASDKFSRRQAAERELRVQGREALPYLMSLDWRQLDAEQRFRLHSLFHELSGGGAEDTPERIALSLIRDPKLWQKLLERADEHNRPIALEQLERLRKGIGKH